MAGAFLRKGAIAMALMVGILAAPVSAQLFSDGYQFLKAVKDRDGEAVTAALNEPGSTVVNSRDLSSGESALHIVTRRRDTVWIRFLSQKGANPNIEDKQGVTPLQIASNLGYVDGVEELLKAGARVDVADSSGETPLIAAVHRRDIAMVRLLLANGASADRNDNSGRSARDYAALMDSSRLTDEFDRADEERAGKTGRDYGPSF
ncbi:MAG: ankyrin repeat domain-containing protein [Alteripontixanthobacter sp.]